MTLSNSARDAMKAAIASHHKLQPDNDDLSATTEATSSCEVSKDGKGPKRRSLVRSLRGSVKSTRKLTSKVMRSRSGEKMNATVSQETTALKSSKVSRRGDSEKLNVPAVSADATVSQEATALKSSKVSRRGDSEKLNVPAVSEEATLKRHQSCSVILRSLPSGVEDMVDCSKEEIESSTRDQTGSANERSPRLLSGDDGRNYVGQFNVGGEREGRGVFTYEDGTVYDGEFLQDKRNGRGVLKWPSSTHEETKVYVGEFENDEMHGLGSFTWFEGLQFNQYDGAFANGQFHGRGLLTSSDGHEYDGEFRHGKREGHGTFKLPNGEQYVGEHQDDAKHGFGVYTWTDGSQYRGEWHQGRAQGKGTLFHPPHYAVRKGTRKLFREEWWEGTFDQNIMNGPGVRHVLTYESDGQTVARRTRVVEHWQEGKKIPFVSF